MSVKFPGLWFEIPLGYSKMVLDERTTLPLPWFRGDCPSSTHLLMHSLLLSAQSLISCKVKALSVRSPTSFFLRSVSSYYRVTHLICHALSCPLLLFSICLFIQQMLIGRYSGTRLGPIFHGRATA